MSHSPADVHRYLVRTTGRPCTTAGCLFCGDHGETAEANVPDEQVTTPETEAPVIEDAAATEGADTIEAPAENVPEIDAAEAPVDEVPVETDEVPAEDASAEDAPADAEAPTDEAPATFSAEELAEAVQAETVKATATLLEEKAALQAKIDALEIAVADEKARAESAVTEFQTYKDEQAAAEVAATLRDARVDAAKDANPNLGEDFFTEERANSYSEMSEDAFNLHVIETLKTAYASSAHPFHSDENAEATTCGRCGKDEQAHLAPAGDEKANLRRTATTKTSAFTGGKTPTAVTGSKGTPTSRLLSAKRAQATTTPVA